ncbi:MAG TPA: energy transducer TonB, partial [Bdellovibrionota bacterium]|nr:energy transducer TonB [Bdellovibrionota bacterium]
GRERTSAGKEVARYGTTQAAPGEQGKLKLELSDSFLKEHAAGPSVASRAPTNYLPEISMGDETLLNTREYVYASFFIRMKRQMENVWDPRNVLSRETRAREQYVTTVGITLRKDGYLESVRILGSSGNPALDREAVRAVRAGAPYLNPPPALVEANGRIVIPSWHFIVTNYARF